MAELRQFGTEQSVCKHEQLHHRLGKQHSSMHPPEMTQIALTVMLQLIRRSLTFVSGQAQQIFFFGFSGSGTAAGSAALPNFHQDMPKNEQVCQIDTFVSNNRQAASARSWMVHCLHVAVDFK